MYIPGRYNYTPVGGVPVSLTDRESAFKECGDFVMPMVFKRPSPAGSWRLLTAWTRRCRQNDNLMEQCLRPDSIRRCKRQHLHDVTWMPSGRRRKPERGLLINRKLYILSNSIKQYWRSRLVSFPFRYDLFRAPILGAIGESLTTSNNDAQSQAGMLTTLRNSVVVTASSALSSARHWWHHCRQDRSSSVERLWRTLTLCLDRCWDVQIGNRFKCRNVFWCWP